MDQDVAKSKTTTSSVGWQAPLVDLCLALVRRRWTVILCVIASLLLGAAMYFKTPETYRSSAVAVLLPREKPLFDVAVDSGTLETSEDGAKRESTGSLMLPANPELYITLIKSRSVMQEVAEAFDQKLTGSTSEELLAGDLIASLKSMTSIEATEEGLLTVTVTASTPQLSAELANAMVGAGEAASKAIERQLILQQAQYIDHSLELASASLRQYMDQLKKFSGDHRVLDPRTQASDRLRQIRELTQCRDDLKRQLAARRLTWSDRDSEVQRMILEISLCDDQIADLQETVVGEAGLTEYGSLVVDYEALIEKVKQQRDLVVSLTAKKDVFHIRAEQPAGSLAIVRPATPPSGPVGPSRKKFLMISLGLGMFMGLGLALVQEQWAKSLHDPYVAKGVKEILKNLHLQRTTNFTQQAREMHT